MCGVAGFAGAVDLDAQAVERMSDAIRHRGPDDSGVHLEPGRVGLGFRRLSIIDVEGGHQPLGSEDRSVLVTCNGELYNFRRLREGLSARGHRFATGSDSEVAAHLWEERGEGMLADLEGMFAIALWDGSTRTLLLARDRMGVKPLYWARVPGGVLWGSEPSAILASGLVSRRPDPSAIAESLVLQYVQAPRTGFADIRKLAPGERLLYRADDDDVDVRSWWTLPRPSPEAACLSDEEAVERLDALLGEVTRERLVADVPVGAFLSGGVDSSVVVSYMAEALPEVRTFSIDFGEARYSEGHHARRVSELYGTRHEDLVVEPEIVPLVAEAVRHVGEPYADSSAIPTYLLAQLTRRSVTVALSGDGGDEAFAGYTRYRLVADMDRMGPLAHAGGVVLRHALPRRAARALRGASTLSLPTNHRYPSVMSHFGPHDLEGLLTEEFASQVDDLWAPWRLLEPDASLPQPNRYQAVDQRTYLPGDLLTKVDRMSMTHALEVRSPMLDHRLHALAATLRPDQRIRGRELKWALKRVAERRGLPSDLVARPKQGFGVPIADWFRAELRPWVEGVLRDERTVARGYFKPAAVDRLLRDHQRGTDHAPRLWNLLTLELWHREYVDVG